MKEMVPEKLDWGMTYRHLKLKKYKSYFKTPGEVIARIDSVLSDKPELENDKANLHRILTHGKGVGKSYLSKLKDGAELFLSFKFSRRLRESHRRVYKGPKNVKQVGKG